MYSSDVHVHTMLIEDDLASLFQNERDLSRLSAVFFSISERKLECARVRSSFRSDIEKKRNILYISLSFWNSEAMVEYFLGTFRCI